MDLSHYSWQALIRALPKNLPVFYRANPQLSFAAREIETIQVKPYEWEVTLNFMGLQGASTPLPIHFSERMIQEDPEDSNLNDFYNFFNQQNYRILVGIEQKYASSHLASKLKAFAGFLWEDESEKTLLPFLASLFGRNVEKNSWCRMIASVFNCEKAWTVERVPCRLAIPIKQRCLLGSHSHLGESGSLGQYVTQAKNHLELHLIVNQLEAYLPNQSLFQKLQSLVALTLRENLFVSLVLHAKQAKTARLSFADPVGLGWSTLLGQQTTKHSVVKLGKIL